MRTNFREAIEKTILWKNPEAFKTYSRLYIASFSAILSFPLLKILRGFIGEIGFEQISAVTVWLMIYKVLLPKFNRDSLNVWTLIYGYFGLFLLTLSSFRISKIKSIIGNGTTS